MTPSTYEARRLQNIARNKLLIDDLKLTRLTTSTSPRKGPGRPRKSTSTLPASTPSTRKRRKRASEAGEEEDATSTPERSSYSRRSSARIAATGERPDYSRRALKSRTVGSDGLRRVRDSVSVSASVSRTASPAVTLNGSPAAGEPAPRADAEELKKGWSAWRPVAPPPTQKDESSGEWIFADRLDFTPNLSPAEILRQGSFGGTYFRALRSQALGVTVEEDWRELPATWLEGLEVERFLTAQVYDAGVNKYGVACGQSIEEWEKHGWINHGFDVRGWFQWYCRFWMGRRCEDDDRQVSRWKKCVGPTGRWRRTLLKRYKEKGVTEVFDDGEGEEQISPVVHQTCFHWAWEIRQGALDEYWSMA